MTLVLGGSKLPGIRVEIFCSDGRVSRLLKRRMHVSFHEAKDESFASYVRSDIRCLLSSCRVCSVSDHAVGAAGL